jgi:putative hydrolase of the HAD superfamily
MMMITDQHSSNNTHAVIFDWGGVLMRTADYAPRHQWDRHLNLDPGTIEKIVHGIPEWKQLQLGQVSSAKYEEAVAVTAGVSHDEVGKLLRDFYSGDLLDDRLITLIRRLRNVDIPVGLLSNNVLTLRDDLIKLNVFDLFSICIISAEIGVMKPDPEAYQACLSALNVTPPQTLMIDDSPANIKGALAVGMSAIQFNPSIDLETQVFNWLDS